MSIPSELQGVARMHYAVGVIVQAEARVTEMLLLLERTILKLPLQPQRGEKPDRRTCRALVEDVKAALGTFAVHGEVVNSARPLLAAIKVAANERNEAAHRAWYEHEESGGFTNTWEFFVRAGVDSQRTRSPEDLLPLVDRFALLLRGLGHIRLLVYDDRGELTGRPQLRSVRLRQVAEVVRLEAQFPRN